MKRIGIPGYTSDTSFGVGKTYLNFASQFGVPRIIMPDEELADVDMLLLTGGLDVNPPSYGQVPSFYTSHTDVFKQYFFDRKLDLYIQSGMPILGICLGAQQLNVKFGGTLTQHIIEPMGHPQSSDRREAAHTVHQVATEFIYDHPELQTSKKFDVNSHHHQGIVARRDKNGNIISSDLSGSLIPLQMSSDGVIEAFIHNKMKIAGIQWHPEEWYDPFSKKLINYLLK